MFCIVNWSDIKQVTVVTDEWGETLLFSNRAKATGYASGELNFFWEVVELREG